MSISRSLAALCVALLFLALPASVTLAQEAAPVPEVTDQYKKTLRRFLEIQGEFVSYSDNVVYGAANETLGQIQASGTQVTEEMSQIVLEESKEKFGKKFDDMDFVTDLFAPVYAKYFTQADLDTMLAFWTTPTGRKNLEAAATLNQETFAAIQQVTFGISPAFQLAVDARLRELGYEMSVDGAPPGAPAAP